MAFDPEHRLVVSVVPGKRTSQNVRQLVQDFKQRTQGRIPNLITTDEYPVYATELLEAYGIAEIAHALPGHGEPWHGSPTAAVAQARAVL